MVTAEAARRRNEAPTAKSLIHTLGRNVRELNLDSVRASQVQRMPSILPGERGVRSFADTLTERGFPRLADALTSVHEGEKKRKKHKNFGSDAERRRFESNAAVINDMRT